MKSQLITNILLSDYEKKQRFSLAKHFKEIGKHKQSAVFAFTHSSVFSSLIEGSGIDMDSYLFNKETGYQNKEMRQIDDLIKAYQFARTHALNYKNLLEAHKILSVNFDMQPKYKGKLRDVEIRVGNYFVTVYVATPAKELASEMTAFFKEIDVLLKRKKYTYNEAFYFASMVHLVFVKIHPFADGNGRAARLLEKWFLAKILGAEAWAIPSEVNYWVKRENYYDNLKLLGKTYDAVNYENALPFLLMLPTAFGLSKKYYSK